MYMSARLRKFDESLYYINTDQVIHDFNEAEADCNTWFNGHLTSVLSIEEWNFIR